MIVSVSLSRFFEDIYYDLYEGVYLALGGSLENDALNWVGRLTDLASLAIKVPLLVAFFWALYRMTVYVIQHIRWQKFTDRHRHVLTLTARLIWIFSSILAVMTQLNISVATIKAFAKAGLWAVIYYLIWVNLEYLLSKVLAHYSFNASLEQLFRNVLSVLIFILGMASMMSQFGFDIVSVVAGLGIVGIAVGFAAQSTLANFIAGITILLEQSFQVGDWVSINNKEGKVVQIALRTTHILTRDNITIIIPNSTVASAEVINLTSKNLIRFDIEVRIALEAQIEEAREQILAVMLATDELLERPEPMATVDKIGDFGVYFIVRFWVEPSHVARMPIIKETLRENIKIALDNVGIATPYPHMRLVLPTKNLVQEIE